MKKYIFSFSLFIFIVIESNGQLSTIDSLALKWDHYKLQNNIQVILQPDPKQKEISIEFWVHAGAANEKKGKFGFAHFFEHATPYGLTKDTALQNAFKSTITNSNAQTRKDFTRYYIQVKPAELALGLKYSADRLKADTATISDTTVEKHRKNVLKEMSRQESNPLYSPTATSARELITFGKNHPYGHSTYGTVTENESFTSSEIKKWYEQYFFTDNIVLFIVGNFEKEKVKWLIEKEFGPIYRKGNMVKLKKTRINTVAENISTTSASPTNFLSITWAVSEWGSEDDPSLQLLANVIDERLAKSRFASISKSGSSDLFKLYQLAGEFGMFASFSSLADSSEIETHLYNIMNDIVENGISEVELKNARLKTIESVKEMSRKLGFNESRTELLGEGLLYTNNPDFYLLRLHKQAKLTTKDIQKVAAKWFKNKGARLLLISINH